MSEFKKVMQKQIFTSEEAKIVSFKNNPALVNLQLHQWKKRGELLALKRGLYAFSDAKPEAAEIARHLCFPCYFSLEYILSRESILPEAVFSYTLVTTQNTRKFQTSFGLFIFQKIKKEAFSGFNSETLMATKEKALVDYFYLNSTRLIPKDDFWEESRLEAAVTEVNFRKVFSYAKLFHSNKLELLLKSFESYAKSH
ncbi:MAG: hypothetical protein Q8P84_08475 [Deltaproteobacteria bacterium]|nr:hypothetical protein [Deltaproteobacteria bacterium]